MPITRALDRLKPLKIHLPSRRARYIRARVKDPAKFDPRSFRTIPVGRRGTKLIIGCPKGQFAKMDGWRCRVGTRTQAVLVPKWRAKAERLRAVANPCDNCSYANPKRIPVKTARIGILRSRIGGYLAGLGFSVKTIQKFLSAYKRPTFSQTEKTYRILYNDLKEWQKTQGIHYVKEHIKYWARAGKMKNPLLMLAENRKYRNNPRGKQLYDIIRFYQDPNKEREIIKRGLTKEEAQKHCHREDTHGEGWFDGYGKAGAYGNNPRRRTKPKVHWAERIYKSLAPKPKQSWGISKYPHIHGYGKIKGIHGNPFWWKRGLRKNPLLMVAGNPRIGKCRCGGEMVIYEKRWDKPISLICKKCKKVVDLKIPFGTRIGKKKYLIAPNNPRRYLDNPQPCPFKKGQKIPIAKFEKWLYVNGTPDEIKRYEKSKIGYKKFHLGANPTFITREIIGIGNNKTITDRDFSYTAGKSPQEVYQTPKNSGKQRISRVGFIHKWKNRPETIVSGNKTIIKQLKGQAKITDWMRG